MSNLSVTEYTEREATFGIVPLLHEKRPYSLVDMIFVAGSFSVATWCYAQGAAIASVMSTPQGLVNLFSVVGAFILLTSLVGVQSARYGIDHWLCQRATWGYFGVIPLVIVIQLSGWGWSAVNAQLFGLSTVKILTAAGTEVSSDWWVKGFGALSYVIGTAIALKGPGAVKWATRIMGIALAAAGLVVIGLILTSGKVGAMWGNQALAGDTSWGSYMMGTEWNIAFTVSWYPIIGALARLSRKEQAAGWGLWIGYGIVGAAYIGLGLMLSHLAVVSGAEATGDPTDYLITLGGAGLGSLALVFVGVANITTAAAATYAVSIAVKIVWPTMRYERVAVFWTLYGILLVLWGGVWDYYPTFLAVIGALNGPALTLLVVDYWLVRRQRLNLRDIFRGGSYRYTAGLNLPAWFAFGAGIASYFVLYDPFNYVPRVAALFNIFTATGFACLVSAVVYLVLAQVPAVKGYLLRDRAQGLEETC